MKISTKGLYAVRLMLELSQRPSDTAISLKDIAETTLISKKYLEQIVPNLVSAKLLKSTRGANGGYRLARMPEEITLLDVLRVTEGSLSPTACLGEDGELDCRFPTPCMELSVWRGLYQAISEYLASVTLRDILNEGSARPGDFYCI